jgi:hypothetical protein
LVQGADVQRLQALGLLTPSESLPAGRPTLLQLCADGALDGGLSVALDVRPDELVGFLCQRIEARNLRIREVRNDPPELWVQLGKKEERWGVPDLGALVSELNRAYRSASSVRAIALLGERDEAHQLWCVPKAALRALLAEGLLEAENAAELSALVAA